MKKHVLLVILMLLPLVVSAQVKRTIHVETAGTLPALIADAEKYSIEDLTLTGELNGTDFRLLRKMAGKGTEDIDDLTDGKLKKLDLSGVKIVPGGDYYLEGPGHGERNRHYCINADELPDYVFSFCNFTELTLPDNLLVIGSSALRGCADLKQLSLPQTLTTIRDAAFSSALTSITIPRNVTLIEGNPFLSTGYFSTTYNLAAIIVEEGNTVYDSREGCNAIIETASNTLISGCSNTVIPHTVVAIGPNAFYYANMSSIVIPDNIKSIGESAFYGCGKLNSIIIPNSVTSIGARAFDECTSLTTVRIPDGLSTLENSVFAYCENLHDVFISASVNSISSSAFYNCPKLTEIVVDPNNKTYMSDDGVLFTKDKSELLKFPIAKPADMYVVPNGVKVIGENAFQGCKALIAANIPESVTSIGNYAFSECENLIAITIPAGITLIGSGTFQRCSNLVSFTVPNTVESIEEYAFSNCSNLTEITFPNSLKSIGNNAFGGCVSLSKIYSFIQTPFNFNLNVFDGYYPDNYIIYDNAIVTVPKNSITEYSEKEGWKYFLQMVEEGSSIPENAYSYTINVLEAGTLSYIIPSLYKYKVKELKLTGVLNGTDMRLIRDMAGNDYQCKDTPGHLKVLDLSRAQLVDGGEKYIDAKVVAGYGYGDEFDYLTHPYEIGANMFAGTRLQTLILPNTTTTISTHGLAHCRFLTSVTIPNGVTSIGDFGIYECSKLPSITVPASVISIGVHAFSDCRNLESIQVEEGNASFVSENGILYNKDKTHLIQCPQGHTSTSFIIPNTVNSIGDYAVYYCKLLESVTIPASVTSIGEWFLYGCDVLKTVISDMPVPPTLSKYSISKRADATLYVPVGCKNAYMEANIWKEFGHIFEPKEEDGLVITPNEDNTASITNGSDASAEVEIPVNITIDNQIYTVTVIAEKAFENNQTMVQVKIPASIVSIGARAFAGCSNLKGIFIFAPEPIVLSVSIVNNTRGTDGASVFEGVDTETCVLYVPAGSKEKYEQADGWKEFKNIVEMGETTPITIGKSGKASYCGDKSLDFSHSDEIKAYIATGYDKDAEIIWLTRVMDVPAGVPVLIKGVAEKTYDVPVTDSQNSYYKNMFKGNNSGGSVKVEETDGDLVNYYLSGDGVFKSVKGYVNIGNNKSYLQLPGTFKEAATGSTQTVTVGASGKASYAAPVDLDFTNVEGLKAFTATGYDKSTKTIWLTRVMKAQKGEGLLLKGDSKDYEIPSMGVQSVYMNMFVGNTSGDKIQVNATSDDGSETNYYLSSDGTFKSVNGYVNINDKKCYLALPTSMVAVASTRSAEESYKLDEPEMIQMPIIRSIESDNNGTTNLTPALSKGEGEWYTLQGQRVAKPGKGLYIRNGKKVVIK